MCTNVGGKVHFVVETDHLIEICYSGESKNCCCIRETIVKEVKVVVNEFSGMENFEEEFYCKICNITKHCHSLNEDKTNITCPYNEGSCDVDQTHQLPWFKPEVQGEIFL